MANKQTSNGNDQEKASTKIMQKRLENLLPQKADIPASISIQQEEELKARVRELEAQLEQQPETADKKTLALVQSADTQSLTPPKKQQDHVPEIQASKVNRTFVIDLLLFVGDFIVRQFRGYS